MLEEQRENWGSRGGFVLAAIGSAVGLGNLWGFPYKLYSYGGGAFLIPYIIAIFCVGIPMMIMEFSLGHFTQRAAPEAFRRVNKNTEFVGWWSIIMGFVIITYYPVILAYCFSFMWFSIEGILHSSGELPWAHMGYEGVVKAKEMFFDKYLNFKPGPELGQIQWQIFTPLVITWLAMYFCIFKGVKLVGKIVWLTVPLPWIMLFILAIRGLTLPGSMKGLTYYLDPVWSQLAEPTTWRYAFGQVFFSLSLAFGVMVTYSSFLHRKSDLNNNAAIIGLADFATSFIAGIAIFTTLGAMSFVTAQAGQPVPVDKVVDAGPGLAFVAFPYALAQLPGSAYWSFVFFFTLAALGIDSAFSITESVLAGIVDKTGWPRWLVLPIMSIIGLSLGIVYITNSGLHWLGTVDGYINGTWGIAFLGLLECLVLGWLYRTESLREHANERSDWKIGRWWNYSIRILIPIVLGTLFFWSMFDDFGKQGGFLVNDQDQWIIENVVGIIIVASAPVIALLFSMIKSPDYEPDMMSQTEMLSSSHRSGMEISLISLILALGALANIIILTFFAGQITRFQNILMIIASVMALAALTVSNHVIRNAADMFEKPNSMARLSGIVAILEISFILASVLNNIKLDKTPIIVENTNLSSVSYMILAIVILVVIIGLGWCFYRALTAAVDQSTENQQNKN